MWYNCAMSLIESKVREELGLDRLNGRPADALESGILEFKQWDSNRSQKDQQRQLREAVVAFANAEGGYIVLGVRDKKKTRAEAIQNLDLLDGYELQKNIYDGTEPHIHVEVVALNEPEGRLLAIRVPNSFLAPHTTTDGVGKIRVGKESKPLTGSTMRELVRTRGEFDRTAEILPEISAASLDPGQFDRLRKIIRESDERKALSELSDQDLLGALGLARDGGLTRATLLLLGKPRELIRLVPGHEVILLEMQDETRYSRRQDLQVPLLEILEQAQKFIDENPRLSPVNLSGFVEAEIPYITWDVFREAVLNALTHRDYFLLQSVYVHHHASQMEVSSPGEFIGGVTPANILRHHPKRRNPLLAEVFQKIGLVNRAGVGVDRIYRGLLRLGKGLPNYRVDEATVKLEIPTETNADFVRFVREEERQNPPFKLDDLIILHGLTQHGSLDALSAGELLHLSAQKAGPKLARLRKRGYLVPSGRGRKTSYRLAPSPADRLKVQLLSEDQNWVDRETLIVRLLQIIRERGRITNAEIRRISGYSRAQTAALMASLRKQGHVTLIDRGRAAHYVLSGKPENFPG